MGKPLLRQLHIDKGLCWRSSFQWLPRSAVSDDGVEGREALSHDRDEGKLLWPTASGEALVVGSEGRATSDGD